MTPVFADTSFYLALFSEDDAWHGRARRWSRENSRPLILLVERGLRLFADRPDKAWSLTDCISFVVMRERGLTEAVATDHHFEQAGFRLLLK